MGVIVWTGQAGDGQWATPANWQDFRAPECADEIGFLSSADEEGPEDGRSSPWAPEPGGENRSDGAA
jgi:hypothetical protein